MKQKNSRVLFVLSITEVKWKAIPAKPRIVFVILLFLLFMQYYLGDVDTFFLSKFQDLEFNLN